MARSYYTDGTSALDVCNRVSGSNLVFFEHRAPANDIANRRSICERVFRGTPCAHELYSFEGASGSFSDKVRSVLALAVPAVAMLLVIVAPVLF